MKIYSNHLRAASWSMTTKRERRRLQSRCGRYAWHVYTSTTTSLDHIIRFAADIL